MQIAPSPLSLFGTLVWVFFNIVQCTLQADRDKEAEEKKGQRLEKLKRVAAGENKAKHDFSDPVYDKVNFHLFYYSVTQSKINIRQEFD